MTNGIDPNKQIFIDAVQFATEKIKEGYSYQDIFGMLLENKVEPVLANFALSFVDGMLILTSQKAGKRKMFFGLIWFIGGSIFSILSYSAAAASPYGGRYIVTWGAIIYGAYLFLKGLSLYRRKPSWPDLMNKNYIIENDYSNILSQETNNNEILENVNKVYCYNCGKPASPDEYFCHSCGKPIRR